MATILYFLFLGENEFYNSWLLSILQISILALGTFNDNSIKDANITLKFFIIGFSVEFFF